MSTKSLNPLKGFIDRYPEDKALQDYIFDTVKSIAALYSFQAWEGPIVEPIELYEGKTSRELLEEQAFTLQDRNGKTLMLRPEITPSLARLVAARVQELNLPIRWFNIGPRFRYEAPQRGRTREFYQMDFDIIGSDSQLADIEIVAIVAEMFTRFGATEKDFVIYINSRAILSDELSKLGIEGETAKKATQCIDKRDKVDQDAFEKMLAENGISDEQIQLLNRLLENTEKYGERFADFLALAETYGIAQYIKVNPMIVRGLDYYTGLVFEVKSLRGLTRSLFGGGRYDNLVGMFGTAQPVPGIGFAASDVVLIEFLREAGLLPELAESSSTVLVTVFSEELAESAVQTVGALRKAGIAAELYPDTAKLQKQLQYASRKNVPFVIVIGPDEAEKGVVMLKDMKAQSQEALTVAEAVTKLSSYASK